MNVVLPAILIDAVQRIEQQPGAQKIDVLVADPTTPRSPVLDAARREGVAL